MSGYAHNGKWAVLRNAFLGRANNADDNKSSIHRHSGFEMLEKTVSPWIAIPVVVSISANKPASMYLALAEKNLRLGLTVELQSFGQAIVLCCNVTAIAIRNQMAVIQSTRTNQVTSEYGRTVDQMKVVLTVRALEIFYACRSCFSFRLFPQPGPLFTATDGDNAAAAVEYEQVRYVIPGGEPTSAQPETSAGSAQSIIVRRRKVGQKPSLREIFSHQHCGVDNTGNVRVWAAEEVMVHYMAQVVVYCRYCILPILLYTTPR
jgi:hypothetical protein